MLMIIKNNFIDAPTPKSFIANAADAAVPTQWFRQILWRETTDYNCCLKSTRADPLFAMNL
jgi:hypothetical protein